MKLHALKEIHREDVKSQRLTAVFYNNGRCVFQFGNGSAMSCAWKISDGMLYWMHGNEVLWHTECPVSALYHHYRFAEGQARLADILATALLESVIWE